MTTTPAFTPDHRFTADRITGATAEQLTEWAREADNAAYGITYCDKSAWQAVAELISHERIARAYPR